jgi:hypothetical protein
MDYLSRCALLLSFIGILSFNNSFIASAEEVDDALLTTPATPEVIAKGLEADGYQLGISAYTWGHPLVRMERVIRSYSHVSSGVPAASYRAAVNTDRKMTPIGITGTPPGY